MISSTPANVPKNDWKGKSQGAKMDQTLCKTQASLNPVVESSAMPYFNEYHFDY